MIDLQPDHIAEVQRILQDCLPGCEVRAFGSRVQGRARRFSDLDIAVISPVPLSLRALEAARDAFAESDLPMRVDLVDVAAVSESFRTIIQQQWVPLPQVPNT